MLKKIFCCLIAFCILATSFPAHAEEEKSLQVSVTVPPSQSHLQLNLEAPQGTGFAQDSTLEYKITYGTTLTGSNNIQVEAYWDDGVIDGISAPKVEIFRYAMGSATPGFNGVTPVIDLVNKKITWNINSFPPQTTNRVVYFKLITNSNYTGERNVSLPVKARLVIPGVISTPFKYANKDYKFKPPTATSTTPTPTLSPAPQATPSVSFFRRAEVRKVTESEIHIFFETSQPSRLGARYGTSQSNLSKNIAPTNLARSHLIKIAGLEPLTRYFIRATAVDSSGRSNGSDVISVITAKPSEPVLLEEKTIVVTSNNSVITDPSVSSQNKGENTILIPKDTNFKFRFSLKDKASAKKIKLKVKNKKVLGASTFFAEEAEANTETAEVIEVSPGVYEATLRTKPEPGEYELYAVIEDNQGNIVEEKIANIKVLQPFTVTNVKNKPIEGVRILVSLYDNNTRKYDVIVSGALIEENPVFTDAKGTANLVLPVGKYSALISNLGYLDQNVKFSIGSGDSDGYPQIQLQSSGFSLMRIARFYYRTVNDIFLLNSRAYVKSLTGSLRFFDLIAAITVLSLITLTFIAFSKRTMVPLTHIPSYLIYIFNKLFRKQRFTESYVHGKVLDVKGKPIPLVHVYLVNSSQESVEKTMRTNKNGEFYFRTKGTENYSLFAMKKGFRRSSFIKLTSGKSAFKITLEEAPQNRMDKIWDYAKQFTSGATGLTFEALLLASLVFEFLMIETFGIAKTLPYLSLSIFNLTVWVLHIHHKH